MKTLIKYQDFVEVTTEALKEINLNQGDRLFIAGHRDIPEYEEDPYWLRRKFIACPLENDHIKSEKFVMVDPRNIKKVSKKEQNRLTSLMEEDFKKDEAIN